MQLLVNILVSGLAVFVTASILPGVEVTGYGDSLIAGIVLGVINAFIKPIISLVALPITVLTLGLFSLVINALMVLLVSAIVPGFHVEGFLPALGFAIVLAIINGFFGMITKS